MFELIKINDSDYFFNAPVKVGLVKLNDSDVCLIDSGLDKDSGKKVLRVINENGWNLKSIYITHPHADHMGANAFLQEKAGCVAYLRENVRVFASYPLICPTVLYGGFPGEDLRHKFLMAKQSTAEALTQETLPCGFEMIELCGHCLDMVGFKTPNGTVYLGDTYSSAATIDKYGITYVYDVGAYLESLEKAKTIEGKVFVPCHADVVEDITDICQYNIDKVHEIADKIKEICVEPMSFDTILQKLFYHYGLTMNAEQQVLVGSTVRSYLSWLKDKGELENDFSDNIMTWRTL